LRFVDLLSRKAFLGKIGGRCWKSIALHPLPLCACQTAQVARKMPSGNGDIRSERMSFFLLQICPVEPDLFLLEINKALDGSRGSQAFE